MGKFERKEKSQPKHKQPASSGASKAPRPPPVQQPGWKGPTYLHKKKPARPPKQPSSATTGDAAANGAQLQLQPQPLPVELQQLVLDIFRETFPASWDFEALKPTLHEVNAALGARAYGLAFGTEAFREAYAIRWGPSRALCFANLLADLLLLVGSSSVAAPCGGEEEGGWVWRFMGAAAQVGSGSGSGSGSRSPRVVCFGGGVSEVMAFGVLVRHLKPQTAGKPSQGSVEPIDGQVLSQQVPVTAGESQDEALPPPPPPPSSPSPSLHVTLVDTADWASVVQKLERGLKTPPALSKYASATARANNASLIDSEAMRVQCTRMDVHMTGVTEMRNLLGPDAVLIPMFFTLNDLYTASITKTTKFLVQVSIAAPKGSLLLVVDSIGACSEAEMSRGGAVVDGTEGGQKYPLAWLVDRLLLNKGTKKNEEGEEVEGDEPLWEKLLGDGGRLFRLAEGLKYPASLENMRYQVHLYRRLNTL